MYLVFDTETTGLPKNWGAPVTQVDNWPRIIQLAWSLHAENGLKISSRCDLIKPNGWVMPKEQWWIQHGFSQEKSMAEGIEIERALGYFVEALDACRYLVAHNISFDEKIVGAEMLRANVLSEAKPRRICTMKAGTDFCQLPGPIGFKWPTLTELHHKLFGIPFEGAHDAGFDVGAAANCFFEMLNRQIIKP